jgi:hypothetical protein
MVPTENSKTSRVSNIRKENQKRQPRNQQKCDKGALFVAKVGPSISHAVISDEMVETWKKMDVFNCQQETTICTVRSPLQPHPPASLVGWPGHLFLSWLVQTIISIHQPNSTVCGGLCVRGSLLKQVRCFGGIGYELGFGFYNFA